MEDQAPERGEGRRHTGKISIVIVDDHPLFRDGLRELLSLEQDFEVVDQAGDGEEGLAVVCRRRPDILLLDVEMPHHQVTRTVPRILGLSPGLRIIILTMHEDPQLANELIKLGARAYLVKSATRAELVSVIRGVYGDERRVVVSMSRTGYQQFGHEDPLLTRRQTQILALAAQALSNAQIADRLFISENTVKRHLTNIYAQLGAVSRVDAINKGRAAVLIPAVDVDWDGSVEIPDQGP